MKNEIKEIINMIQEGKISPDQAANLIEALKNESEPKQEKKKTTGELNGLGEFVAKAVQNALSGSSDMIRGKVGKGKVKFRFSNESESEANNINISQIANPEGQDFEFEGNEINMSSLKGLEFEHSSEFCKNQIHASSLNSIKLSTGEVLNSEFHGSSIENLDVDGGTIDGCEFHGSKVNALNIKKHSQLIGCELHGSSLKGFTLDGESSLKNCELHGCHFSDVHFDNVKWANAELHRCTLVNCKVLNVDLTDFELTGLSLKDAKIDGNTDFKSYLQSK